MKKIILTALGAAMLMAVVAVPVGARSGSDRENPATYSVTITNVTDQQYLTPPNWAAHNNSISLYAVGSPASPGLQAVAENGAVPVLAAEIAGFVDARRQGISGVATDAPIAPGASVTFEFTTVEGYFSMASMLICTNDGFGGIDRKSLPSRDGQTRTYRAQAFDAGTEVNTELFSDLVPVPFCGGNGAGTGETNPELAENGVIEAHPTIAGVGDLGSGFDFRRDVARVTVVRHPAA